jgi:hypothetical protein
LPDTLSLADLLCAEALAFSALVAGRGRLEALVEDFQR